MASPPFHSCLFLPVDMLLMTKSVFSFFFKYFRLNFKRYICRQKTFWHFQIFQGEFWWNLAMTSRMFQLLFDSLLNFDLVKILFQWLLENHFKISNFNVQFTSLNAKFTFWRLMVFKEIVKRTQFLQNENQGKFKSRCYRDVVWTSARGRFSLAHRSTCATRFFDICHPRSVAYFFVRFKPLANNIEHDRGCRREVGGSSRSSWWRRS